MTGTYFVNKDLLKPPLKRAAFSDRTAYVMAEMSRLAYFRFEGGTNIDDLLKLAGEFVPDKEKFATLEHLIKSTVVTNTSEEAEGILKEILAQRQFELVQTFNDVSTDAQAFLCRHLEQKIAILAFRGTEPKLKDIKADVTATLETVESDGRQFTMHGGYYAQFNSIRDGIQAALGSGEMSEYQLFITGHSLGGALAITAVKFLSDDSSGACYTFGSPPVGTKDFDADIKTPIYRIINHVDIVPRLPNPVLVHVIRLLGVLFELVLSPLGKIYSRIAGAGWYKKLEQLLHDAGQYRQSGYGSYLVGNASEARLRYSVGIFDQLTWWLKQFRNIFRGDTEIISDHSMELYAKMLARWAESRKVIGESSDTSK